MLDFFFNENGEKLFTFGSHMLSSRYPKREAKRFIKKELKKKLEWFY